MSINIQASPDRQPSRKILQMMISHFGANEYSVVTDSDGLPNSVTLYLEH